jgi:DNA-binding response OmpR family regulator
MTYAATATVAAPILIVDDDPTTCDVVRAYLERDGHRVVVCRTGDAALDIARQTAPRCVVLDVMLPGRDGFSICEEIRRCRYSCSVREPTSPTVWWACASAPTTTW